MTAMTEERLPPITKQIDRDTLKSADEHMGVVVAQIKGLMNKISPPDFKALSTLSHEEWLLHDASRRAREYLPDFVKHVAGSAAKITLVLVDDIVRTYMVSENDMFEREGEHAAMSPQEMSYQLLTRFTDNLQSHIIEPALGEYNEEDVLDFFHGNESTVTEHIMDFSAKRAWNALSKILHDLHVRNTFREHIYERYRKLLENYQRGYQATHPDTIFAAK